MTPIQRNCLEAIRRLTAGGVSPSYDQLAGELGLTSKSSVFRLINQLEQQGLVRRDYHRARSITVVADAPAYAPAALDLLSTEALDDLIAHASGIRAHRTGAKLTDQMLRRIGDRLVGRPRVSA